MNSDRAYGLWKRLTGCLLQVGGRSLSNVALVALGRRRCLAGRLQDAFGRGKENERADVASHGLVGQSLGGHDSEPVFRPDNG